ncbi:MAG: class I SAM-dependent methyltransferase [Bacteroidetes bacterium]|nr:class I SAM-dependent methyltransferase [Bacteroidota bacterium]
MFSYLRYFRRNQQESFVRNQLLLKMYPNRQVYEIFGKLDYHRFFASGEFAAQSIHSVLKPYFSAEKPAVLDLGCGLSRVLNPLKKWYPEGTFHGCDLDGDMIQWNARHFPENHYTVNLLDHPLPYSDQSFDLVFSLSVVTHLDADSIRILFGEVSRILKPGGFYLFTTIDDFYASRNLYGKEREAFYAGQPVLRPYKDGSRLFTSYTPTIWIISQLPDSLTLQVHHPGADLQIAGSQDVLVVRKKG